MQKDREGTGLQLATLKPLYLQNLRFYSLSQPQSQQPFRILTHRRLSRVKFGGHYGRPCIEPLTTHITSYTEQSAHWMVFILTPGLAMDLLGK